MLDGLLPMIGMRVNARYRCGLQLFDVNQPRKLWVQYLTLELYLLDKKVVSLLLSRKDRWKLIRISKFLWIYSVTSLLEENLNPRQIDHIAY